MIAANLSTKPGRLPELHAFSSFCKAESNFCKFSLSFFICPVSNRDSWPTSTDVILAISVSVFPSDFRR